LAATQPARDGATGNWLESLIDERLRADGTDLYHDLHSEVDRRLLARVLQHTGGNQLQAARILGITRGKLRGLLRALGINPREGPASGPEAWDSPEEPPTD